MLKNKTYKEKFVLLKKWMPAILEEVKRDLKQEHLQQDKMFLRQYFSTMNPNKIDLAELVKGYCMAIEAGDRTEEIGEFITSRWILKNTDLYHYFEKSLAEINPDFNEIEELNSEQSEKIVHEAAAQFGPVKTLLFSVLNSVVFPKEIYDALQNEAQKRDDAEKEAALEEKERAGREELIRKHELEIARLSNKFQKKLMGMEEKYLKDTKMLKTQISQLQRKLHETLSVSNSSPN